MSGIDRIIEKVLADTQVQCKSVEDEGNARAKEYISSVRAEADRAAEAIKADADVKYAASEALAQSSGERVYRQALLSEKIAILDDVMRSVLERLNSLSDDEYFEHLLKLAVISAHKGEDGFIRFSAKDGKRLPADFIEKLNSQLSGSRVTLDKTVAGIDGGFLLIYGDIEENCSFEAMLSGRSDELRDLAASMLF